MEKFKEIFESKDDFKIVVAQLADAEKIQKTLDAKGVKTKISNQKGAAYVTGTAGSKFDKILNDVARKYDGDIFFESVESTNKKYF